MPNALSRAATFLMTYAKTPDANPHKDLGDDVQPLVDALRNLKDVNMLARELLHKLEPAGPISRRDFLVSY